MTGPATRALRPSPEEHLVQDLNDLVVTRLSKLSFDFAALTTLAHGEAKAKAAAAVADLDAIIRGVRHIVFGILDVPNDGPGSTT